MSLAPIPDTAPAGQAPAAAPTAPAPSAPAAAAAQAPAADAPAAATASPVSDPSKGTPSGADVGSQSAAEGATSDDLSTLVEMSAEERKEFGEAVNALSPDARKLFQKFLTQKTQGIADVRKAVQAQAELLESLRNDPIGMAEKIIAEAKAKGVQPGQPHPPSTPTEIAAAEVASETAAVLKKHLGPELDFLGDRLGPAIEEIASAIAEKKLGPHARQAEVDAEASRIRAAESEATAFAKANPDWEKHSKRMTELAQSISFADSVTPGEQLAHLHKIASAEARDGAKAKDTVDLINASAAAAATSTPTQGVSPSRVTDNRKDVLTLKESWNAAKRELEQARA